MFTLQSQNECQLKVEITHLQHVKVWLNNSAVLVQYVCRSTERDFTEVEVFSAVTNSSGALEECIAKKDVAFRFVN